MLRIDHAFRFASAYILPNHTSIYKSYEMIFMKIHGLSIITEINFLYLEIGATLKHPFTKYILSTNAEHRLCLKLLHSCSMNYSFIPWQIN